MTKVQLLEREVRKLDSASLESFRAWFLEFDSAAWDRQIRRDVRSSRLTKLSAQALASHARGQSREL